MIKSNLNRAGIELKGYKHLLVYVEDGKLYVDPQDKGTIYCESGAGMYNQMAMDAVDLLAEHPDRESCVFDFNSVFGTFHVRIGREFTYDDAVEYTEKLFNLEEKKYKMQNEILRKMEEEIALRKDKGNEA